MSAEHDLQQLRDALQEARSDKERLTRAHEALREIRTWLVDWVKCASHTQEWSFYVDKLFAGLLIADLDRSVVESAKEEPSAAALSRVGERIDAQQHKIQELESLVAKSAETADVRADAGMWSGTHPRIVTLRRERDEAVAALREAQQCPACFGKGLENQDDRPGILLGPRGENECRACGGTGCRV